MLQDVLDGRPRACEPDGWPRPRSCWPASLRERGAARGHRVRGEPRARRRRTLTVAVTDRGSGPLEAHLAQPRRRYGRAASHGRGLGLVAAAGRGVGHPPRRRRPARRLVRARAAPPARPAPAAGRTTRPPTAAGRAPSRPGGCCTCRRRSRTGCSRWNWSRSSCAGCATCSTARRDRRRRRRRRQRAPPRSPAGRARGRRGRARGGVARHAAAAGIDPPARPAERPRRRRGPGWSWSPTASPWRWRRAGCAPWTSAGAPG